MTSWHFLAFVDGASAIGWIAPARRSVTTTLNRLQDWADRAQQRRTLSSLDDRLLGDIGCSRADAAQEAEKPFWR